MNRHARQIIGLTLFASISMAIGMGLGRTWIVRAQEHQPVSVNTRAFEQQPIVEIVEKLNPTVVYVENTSYVRTRSNRYFGFPDDFFDDFFGQQTPRRNRQQEGNETPQRGGGSGFFISHDGEILTNAHVVEGLRGSENPRIEIRTIDGKRYPAVVLGMDKALDIAIIKIEIQNAPYVKLGDSDSTKVGELVVAIGNPLGLEHTVTQGIISAKGRSSNRLDADANLVAGFLQTDAAINHGNSGGPLINYRGEVIGVNTAIQPAGQNIGFAVPITPIKQILAELRTGKPLRRGWLGVRTLPLDHDYQESLGISEGALIEGVEKSSPADKAGLQRLDVIVGVDGRPIKEGTDLVEVIASRRQGEVVKLEIIRGGRKQTIAVTLGDRSNMGNGNDSDDRPPTSGDDLRREAAGTMNLEKTYGFEVGALDAQNRRTYQIPDDVAGVVITKVAPRTSASDRRLSEGMVIQSVGTKDIASLEEFRSEVQKASGRTILLSVRVRSGRNFSEPTTVAIPAMPAN
ncbi:MAG: trypsin-like peptidase domain-containing protein [Holophagaceae bacterium]|nr:trypsin-like peptidase domain-containing protein [Holophagaceae bacterium]